LNGSLAWRPLTGGRYAVFTHIGPYDELHRAWRSVYGQWLPATGYALRDVPPFEHYVNDPRSLPPAQWRTDLHVPLQ
jgi:AraC family transcriptional regulator